MEAEQEEILKPTFFELIAQDQLRDLLGPVTRYVLSVFAQHHPRYLIRILNHHDELFALAMFFVERHYLTTWSGSFSENFYGLTRRRRSPKLEPIQLPSSSDPDRLRKYEIRLSLIFLVLFPYLRTKAHELYEKLAPAQDSDLLDDQTPSARPNQPSVHQDRPIAWLKQKLLDIFLFAFPYLNAAYKLNQLIFSLRHLFDKSPYWRASNAFMNVQIRRMSPQNFRLMKHQLIQRRAHLLSHLALSDVRWNGIGTILKSLGTLIAIQGFESLKIVLPSSIFAFKFLEWWYSSSNTSRYRRSAFGSQESQFPPLKPPVPLRPQIEGVLDDGAGSIKPIQKGHCPLCKLNLVNATALPSGWVYCYKCVHAYVLKFQQCPVTLFPVSLVDLRKIIG
ncbi:hypothetical protein O181_022793 [Austropuccinia psidii MF-1]|uniref:Peroxisome assembly protein 12 n=1 Tax=Austropuccinia psidii MF-1 TaxID=1389203 RepID=A0A9Q3CFX0_9BASI|nr:hypothetical protein [Austropuccinia psidii MF-1]